MAVDHRPFIWTLVGIVALGLLGLLVTLWPHRSGGALWYGGMMGLMGIWMLVPILLIVWLIVAITGGVTSGSAPDALSIAERRYAAGEIARDEYERIRDDITRPRP